MFIDHAYQICKVRLRTECRNLPSVRLGEQLKVGDVMLRQRKVIPKNQQKRMKSFHMINSLNLIVFSYQYNYRSQNDKSVTMIKVILFWLDLQSK